MIYEEMNSGAERAGAQETDHSRKHAILYLLLTIGRVEVVVSGM